MNPFHLSEVWQEDVSKGFIEINFKLDGYPYLIYVSNETGFFEPFRIEHQFGTSCPLCHELSLGGRCRVLSESFLDEVFHQLIEFPSIRLYWVFLNIKNRQ